MKMQGQKNKNAADFIFTLSRRLIFCVRSE